MKAYPIVARFKDGSSKKGTSSDLSPFKETFHIELNNGERNEIHMNDLKAIFFVKSFEGNKNYKDRYKHMKGWDGKRVGVHFNDGEVIVGYILDYAPDQMGFFITPADPEGNNERVFILNSAVKKLLYL